MAKSRSAAGEKQRRKPRPPTPGERLRKHRERLGLTLRDVALRTRALAERQRTPRCFISTARLSHIERNNASPTLLGLHVLAAVYHLAPVTILRWYDFRTRRIL